MPSDQSTVVLEIDGKHNENFYFAPLGRPVRGRFVWARVPDLQSRNTGIFPGNGEDIPSQQIELNTATGIGRIVDSLYEERHEPIRRRIEIIWRLPPRAEEFKGVDVPTWTYHMMRAVENGIAKVVSGKLPKEYPPDAVRAFHEPPPDKSDGQIAELADVVRAQGLQIANLVRALTAATKAAVGK